MIPYSTPITLMGPGGTSSNPNSLPLTSANTWVAFSFIAKKSTLDGFWFATQAAGSGQENLSIQIELQTDVAGSPSNTALFTDTRVGTAMINIYSYFAFPCSGLTIGGRYWIVFKNTSASPSTLYPAIQFCLSHPMNLLGIDHYFGYAKKQSTDGIGTWNTTGAVPSVSGIMPVWDGVIDNIGLIREATSGSDNASSGRTFNGRSAGGEFCTPNRDIWITGFSTNVRRAGSPTGTIKAVVYSNGVKIAESFSFDVALVYNNGGTTPFLFPDVVKLKANTLIQIVTEMSEGDAGTNFCYNNAIATINPANSNLYPLKPFGGSLTKVYLDSSTWVKDPSKYPLVFLLWTIDIVQYPLNRRRYFNQR